MDIREALNQLSELQAAIDAANLQKQEMVVSVIPPEISVRLAEIDAEFTSRIETAREKAAALEAEIKSAVIENGASVKGDYLQAVYSKPRITWDSGLLEGLMIAIPQLEKARKIGQPSVSFRKV
jgi:hypothetical protein